MYDAVAIGELLVDFVIQGTNSAGYPVLSAYPGGAPANYLAALSGLGMKTSAIAKVGADAFARLLIRSLKEQGIGDDKVVCDGAFFTTLAFITLDENGDREFSFARKPGADMGLGTDELDLHMLAQTRSIYFGTTALTEGPEREAVRHAVAHGRKHGAMVVFDPNLRPPLWDDLNRAKKEMLWGLSQADVVKLSQDECEFLFGDDMEAAMDVMLRQYGVSLVFITLGKHGCYFGSHKARGHVNGLKGIDALDTTGAGDIFAGSAVYKILTLGRDPRELCEDELYDIARFSSASAGLSTTRQGGMTSMFSEQDICSAMLAMDD